MTKRPITLRAWKREILPPIPINQGDILSRTVIITLEDYNGKLIDLTGAAVRVHFTKPDTKVVYLSAEIVNPSLGCVSVTLDSQCVAVKGTVTAIVQVTGADGGNLYLTGLSFDIADIDIENSIESANEFTALTEALSTVQQYDGRIATNTADIAELQTDKADKSEVEDLDANKADKSELGIKKRVLWNGSLTSNDTTVTLSDDLSNYAMILVVGRANQWGHYPVGVTMPINTIDGAGWHIGTDLNNKLILSTSAELIFQFPTSKSLKSITGFSEVNQISTVYGLI